MTELRVSRCDSIRLFHKGTFLKVISMDVEHNVFLKEKNPNL